MKKYVKLFEEFISSLNEINYELDRHSREFRNSTIEFDVKNPRYPSLEDIMKNVSYIQTQEEYEETIQYLYETGAFVNRYSSIIFDDILTKIPYKYIELIDWSFTGRSGGWFVIEYSTMYDEDEEDDADIYEDINKIETIVDQAFRGFSKALITYLRDGELTLSSLSNIFDSTIVEWSLKNNIDLGFSDDVKDIASTAMKGNHKLR